MDKRIKRMYYPLNDAVAYLAINGFECSEADLLHCGVLGNIEIICNKPLENQSNGLLLIHKLTEYKLKNDTKVKGKTSKFTDIASLETQDVSTKFEYFIGDFDFVALHDVQCFDLEQYGHIAVYFGFRFYDYLGQRIHNEKFETEKLNNGNFLSVTSMGSVTTTRFINEFDLGFDITTDKGQQTIDRCSTELHITKNNLYIRTVELDRLIDGVQIDVDLAKEIKGIGWIEPVREEAIRLWEVNNYTRVKQLEVELMKWCSDNQIVGVRGKPLTFDTITRHALQKLPRKK